MRNPNIIMVLPKIWSRSLPCTWQNGFRRCFCRFWTIPPKCSMVLTQSRSSCPSFRFSPCIGNCSTLLRDVVQVGHLNHVVLPVDWSKFFASRVTECRHIKLVAKVGEEVVAPTGGSRATPWLASGNGLDLSAGSIHCTFGSQRVGLLQWWNPSLRAMSGWRRLHFSTTQWSRLLRWRSNSRDMAYKIQKRNVKAAGTFPILLANMRVDWLGIEDHDITAHFPILREGILRDVFAQRASAAWQGAPPQKIIVSLSRAMPS